MHHSMKSGFDGVRSSMNADMSANVMMDKAQRLGKKRQKTNATQITRQKLWVTTECQHHLTDYCAKMIQEQLHLAKHCTGIQVDANTYWIYTPTPNKDSKYDSVTMDEFLQKRYLLTKLCDIVKIYYSDRTFIVYVFFSHLPFEVPSVTKSPICHFQRVRVVKIVNGKYCSCSCGLPARKKYPCRHIIYIFPNLGLSMFGVRWLLCYQHYFQRAYHNDISPLLREMEVEEFSRKWKEGEHVLVYGLFRRTSVSTNYPSPMPGTSNEEVQFIVNLMNWTTHGRIYVRGVDEHIPVFVEESSMVGEDDSVSEANTCVHFSSEIQQMHDDDANFAKYNQLLLSQQDQQEVIEELMNSDEACDQKVVGIVREGLKIGTGNKQIQEYIEKKIEEWYYDLNEYAASVTATEANNPNISEGLQLSQSGTSNKNIERRNKSQYYK